jgi:muconolactone delta-isomerase
MQFLTFLNLREGSLRSGVLTPELVLHEVQQMKELHSAGIVLDAWKRSEMKGVVVLFEATMEEDCRAVIATLPFRQAGILIIEEIMPVEPYLEAFPEPGEACGEGSYCESARDPGDLPAAAMSTKLFLFLLRLRSKPLKPETLTPELIKLEIQRIRELLASGLLRGAWKRINMAAIAVLFEASSEGECRAAVDMFPFSQAGILETEAVMPVKLYSEIYPDPLLN